MAVKSKHLMSEISLQIQFLQKDVTNLTEIYQQRREIVEKHCCQCRDLFKPWPAKIVRTCCSEDATDEDLNKFEDDKQFTSFQLECEKEKDELAMLDDILAKAQHAREIQSKFNQSKSIKKSSCLKSTKGSSSLGIEAKTKPKVSYPVVKRHSPAKSTYAASYTNPARIKISTSGIRRTISNSSKSKTQQQESKKKVEQNKTTSVEMKTSLKCISGSMATSIEQGSVDTNVSETTKAVSGGKFLILENGANLNMPSEFSEVFKKNKKLQSKVQKAKNLLPRRNEEQFMAKTENFFSLSLPSVLTLSEKICRLEIEYRNILRLIRVTAPCVLDSIERNGIDGGSDWLTLMTKFEQLNQDTTTLNENLCQLSMHCPFSKYKSRHAKLFEKPVDQKCQDPRDLWSFDFTNLGEECWKLDSNGFFSYHDIKELGTVLKLSHDYNIMKYQLELKTMVGETLLPLLKQLPENHESFILLCRAIYSILCCEGKTFPTLVKDTLPED